MAKYSDIKGFTVQTLSSDTATSAVAGGTWASGGAGNTGREGPGSNGTQTSNLAYGGSPPATNKTESYNGTAFTEVADLNTTRYSLGGAGVSNTSAVGFGGYAPGGASAVTETWDGSSWTEVNDLNTGRYGIAGAGIITSAIGIAGYTTTIVNNVETWNGSSWTETTDINTTRYVVGATGHDNEAVIIFGGAAPSKVDNVEVWNGSSWTEVSEINSARNAPSGSGTDSLALAYGGRTPSPGATTKTESWDGTSWTEINDLSTGRAAGGGSNNGTSSAALFSFGNREPGLSPAATEEFTAPAVFSKITEGQLYFNSTTNTFKETVTDFPGATWSSGGSFPTSALERMGGAGTQTAAVSVAGYSPGGSSPFTGAFAGVFKYDGTSWSSNPNNYPTTAYGLWGSGTQTAGLFTGGAAPANIATTNKFDGTSFTSTGNLNTARRYLASAGTQTATIASGGYITAASTINESFNGSSWTEVNDFNTARQQHSQIGTSTAALALGNSPAASVVESWDGTNWTTITSLNAVKQTTGASGIQTSGLVYAGEGASPLAQTEFWNGTTWTEVADLSTGGYGVGSLGGSAPATTTVTWAGNGRGTNTEEWTVNLANKTITAS